jgi:WD40 repeat protein
MPIRLAGPLLRWTVTTLLCVPLLMSCTAWTGRIHPDFVQTFIDVNRGSDDRAATVVFDPQMRLLAVGRESGRLELWDARKAGERIVRNAHAVRTQHIAFGREDGIVLTNSVFDNSAIEGGKGTQIWDARSGDLLHTLKDMWAPGPIAAIPAGSLYLIGDSSELLLYDHSRRSIVGSRLRMDKDAQVTAIAADRKSGLIAVGTSNGDLVLMKIDTTRDGPQLAILRRASPYGQQARSDILALTLLDEGTRLISAARRADETGEVAEWDVATLAQRRTFPITLNTVNWASSTVGEPWLVLAGTESTRGKVELVDLRNGVAWRYKANTTHPRAVLLPEIRAGLIMQSGRATQIRYLDQE